MSYRLLRRKPHVTDRQAAPQPPALASHAPGRSVPRRQRNRPSVIRSVSFASKILPQKQCPLTIHAVIRPRHFRGHFPMRPSRRAGHSLSITSPNTAPRGTSRRPPTPHEVSRLRRWLRQRTRLLLRLVRALDIVLARCTVVLTIRQSHPHPLPVRSLPRRRRQYLMTISLRFHPWRWLLKR